MKLSGAIAHESQQLQKMIGVSENGLRDYEEEIAMLRLAFSWPQGAELFALFYRS
jgi:hypothetical protein